MCTGPGWGECTTGIKAATDLSGAWTGTMTAGPPPGEFDGPSHHFDMFDKNHDGFLSREEAPTGPPPGKNATFRSN